jgi:hypothetical protein
MFFASSPFFAQLSMQQNKVTYDDTERPCIEVKLQPNTDEVKEKWKDFVKDNYDVKMRGIGFLANKDVMYAEEVTFKNISPKALNFYTKVVEDGDETMMCVFGSFGYDIHISSSEYPTEWMAMKNMVTKFLNNYLPEFYKDKIEKTESQLNDLQKNKDDMQDELSDNKKEIKKLTKRNEELEEKLSEAEKRLKATNAELVNKKQSLKNVKNELKKMN